MMADNSKAEKVVNIKHLQSNLRFENAI